MRKLSGILLVMFICLAPVSAHHAFTAEFDENKMVTVQGVLTRVDWINPHAYFFVDAKDQVGSIKTWTIETFPPAALRKAGMERDMLKVGKLVTVEGYAAKDRGKNLTWAHKIQFADGQTIIMSRDPAGKGE